MSPAPRPLDELWDVLNQPSKQLEQGDKALLQEALTHTSSGLNPHHEQLEFLGDAVLRLTASEFIASAYPRLPVGERSSLRAQLVSDRWLAELGQRIELEPLLNLGATAHGDAAARDQLQGAVGADDASTVRLSKVFKRVCSMRPSCHHDGTVDASHGAS